MTTIDKHWRVKSLDATLLEVAFETVPTDMRDMLLLFRHGCADIEGSDEQAEQIYRSRCISAGVAPYAGFKVASNGGPFRPTIDCVYATDVGEYSTVSEAATNMIHGQRFYELQFVQDNERGGGLSVVREQHWPLLKKDGYRLHFASITLLRDYRVSEVITMQKYDGEYEVMLEIRDNTVSDKTLDLVSWHQSLEQQFSLQP
jgi:hypothetical protein